MPEETLQAALQDTAPAWLAYHEAPSGGAMELGDELAVLGLVASRLDAAGIPYMVSGSVAMNLYAQPRMTRDIDVVVALEAPDASRITALLEPDFICELVAVEDAIRHRGMFNAIHREWVVKVDFVIRKDTPFRREEFSRRRRVRVNGREISIVTAEDLILSKLYWAKDSHSELQLRDVRNLLQCVESLDWSYLERWAPEISVSGLLSEVRS